MRFELLCSLLFLGSVPALAQNAQGDRAEVPREWSELSFSEVTPDLKRSIESISPYWVGNRSIKVGQDTTQEQGRAWFSKKEEFEITQEVLLIGQAFEERSMEPHSLDELQVWVQWLEDILFSDRENPRGLGDLDQQLVGALTGSIQGALEWSSNLYSRSSRSTESYSAFRTVSRLSNSLFELLSRVDSESARRALETLTSEAYPPLSRIGAFGALLQNEDRFLPVESDGTNPGARRAADLAELLIESRPTGDRYRSQSESEWKMMLADWLVESKDPSQQLQGFVWMFEVVDGELELGRTDHLETVLRNYHRLPPESPESDFVRGELVVRLSLGNQAVVKKFWIRDFLSTERFLDLLENGDGEVLVDHLKGFIEKKKRGGTHWINWGGNGDVVGDVLVELGLAPTERVPNRYQMTVKDARRVLSKIGSLLRGGSFAFFERVAELLTSDPVQVRSLSGLTYEKGILSDFAKAAKTYFESGSSESESGDQKRLRRLIEGIVEEAYTAEETQPLREVLASLDVIELRAASALTMANDVFGRLSILMPEIFEGSSFYSVRLVLPKKVEEILVSEGTHEESAHNPEVVASLLKSLVHLSSMDPSLMAQYSRLGISLLSLSSESIDPGMAVLILDQLEGRVQSSLGDDNGAELALGAEFFWKLLRCGSLESFPERENLLKRVGVLRSGEETPMDLWLGYALDYLTI